jgi:hypothetical protein
VRKFAGILSRLSERRVKNQGRCFVDDLMWAEDIFSFYCCSFITRDFKKLYKKVENTT